VSACGGSNGPGSLTGDPTYAFDVKSAFLVHLSAGEVTVPEVLLTDQPWTCADLKAQAAGEAQISSFVAIGFGNTSGAAVTAGDFTVVGLNGEPTGSYALVILSSGSNDMDVTSGTATLDDLTTTHAEGSFEVTDGTAQVSGTFDADFCDVDLQ